MDDTEELPESMAPREVADLLGYAPVTVLRWIHRGKVQARRSPGGTYRVPRAEVRKLLAAVAAQPDAETDSAA
jgi:putative resolvase